MSACSPAASASCGSCRAASSARRKTWTDAPATCSRCRRASNISTSQQLLALAAAVYLTLLGPAGLRQVAALCYHRAHYAAGRIAALTGFRIASDAPFFKEFVVRCPGPPRELLEALLERGILGGLDVSDRVEHGLQ